MEQIKLDITNEDKTIMPTREEEIALLEFYNTKTLPNDGSVNTILNWFEKANDDKYISLLFLSKHLNNQYVNEYHKNIYIQFKDGINGIMKHDDKLPAKKNEYSDFEILCMGKFLSFIDNYQPSQEECEISLTNCAYLGLLNSVKYLITEKRNLISDKVYGQSFFSAINGDSLDVLKELKEKRSKELRYGNVLQMINTAIRDKSPNCLKFLATDSENINLENIGDENGSFFQKILKQGIKQKKPYIKQMITYDNVIYMIENDMFDQVLDILSLTEGFDDNSLNAFRELAIEKGATELVEFIDKQIPRKVPKPFKNFSILKTFSDLPSDELDMIKNDSDNFYKGLRNLSPEEQDAIIDFYEHNLSIDKKDKLENLLKGLAQISSKKIFVAIVLAYFDKTTSEYIMTTYVNKIMEDAVKDIKEASILNEDQHTIFAYLCALENPEIAEKYKMEKDDYSKVFLLCCKLKSKHSALYLSNKVSEYDKFSALEYVLDEKDLAINFIRSINSEDIFFAKKYFLLKWKIVLFQQKMRVLDTENYSIESKDWKDLLSSL